ncbi:uncharacterized protein LOC131937023 isoform X2 [Physella acuta]|uniref:uncharacterized protein LOC131937023 isoform X2 n=1 Tax=Physella acuta TaxID=109671 RepID=UPI0027DC77BF|nr:uncharacterized protein LOC131937023 isoform X2 [Physella acuta]XP_059150184.1 uncharacterized protein LOC131937023 isoform X2 [Physella acuta]
MKRSRGKMAPEHSQKSLLKMDHSNIYKENVVLEEGLMEHIGNIKRDERRIMAEAGEQLEEIRKQVEVITKLQEAVRNRNPGESVDMLTNTRATRYGIDFAELAKTSRSQTKLDLEREKFSSKNLFNVRRARSEVGFESLPVKKFFHPPVIEVETAPSVVAEADDETKPALPEPTPERVKSSKGYLKPTASSQIGVRPATSGHFMNSKPDDLLPPRAQTAVYRSRSRRELELLSRVSPQEDDTLLTFDNRRRTMEVLGERRRRSRLEKLRVESSCLQGKVNEFITDIERFNQRQTVKNSLQRRDTALVFKGLTTVL